MDLTLESAFSTGGMVGHLSFFLLVMSMLMREMSYLRILVIASSLVAITYDFVWLRDPVGVFWESLLVTVNIVQLALLWRADLRARFTPEEDTFRIAHLPALGPGDARKLLDCGMWADSSPGETLTAEGQRPSHLTFLASGTVVIDTAGRHIADVAPGGFIGEMSLVANGTASADAHVSTPARLWQIATDRFEKLRVDAPHLSAALEAAIARDMAAKIMAANAARV